MSVQVIPSLPGNNAEKAVEILQRNLDVFNDLALTLKHSHWNVTGENFIAVHEMIDPEVEAAREVADVIAERIAQLGFAPNGLTSSVQNANKVVGEFPLNKRASVKEHLTELHKVYSKVDVFLRESIAELDELDLVSSNILQDAIGNLEVFAWKVRSHLE